MPLYNYSAVKLDGEKAEGQLEAADKDSVIAHLQQSGFIPVKISGGEGLLSRLGLVKQRQKKALTEDQILMLTRQIATLMGAGLTLDRSLQTLRDLTDDEAFSKVLTRLHEKIKKGGHFSDALSDENQLFSKLYINMVKAGEAGGIMATVLDRLALYLERSQALKETVRSALVYPMILGFVAGGSILLLLIFVVPRFQNMFSKMGQELPLATQIVFAMGDFISTYWWVIVLLIIIIVRVIKSHLAIAENAYAWDKKQLTLPLWGDFKSKVETARFTRTLATLLENGLPILTALNLVKDVLSNRLFTETVDHAVEQLRHGHALSDSLLKEKVMPKLAVQMIKVGEEAGDMGPMLTKVADVYDKEVNSSIKRLLTLLEPAMIIIMGVVVGGIIVAILMAMLSINDFAA